MRMSQLIFETAIKNLQILKENISHTKTKRYLSDINNNTLAQFCTFNSIF